MPRLILTTELLQELDDLQERDIDAAAAATLLLESLKEDDEQLENLCVPENHYRYEPSFEIKRFGEAQKRGYNVLILKFLDEYGSLPSYRIFIGFHAQRDTYYALAITNRNISYSTHQVEFRNLLSRYEECGIPLY